MPAPPVPAPRRTSVQRPDQADQPEQQAKPQNPQPGPHHQLPWALVLGALGEAPGLVLDFPVPLPNNAFGVVLAHRGLDPDRLPFAPKRRRPAIVNLGGALARGCHLVLASLA